MFGITRGGGIYVHMKGNAVTWSTDPTLWDHMHEASAVAKVIIAQYPALEGVLLIEIFC